MKGFRCPKCGQAEEIKLLINLSARMNDDMTKINFIYINEIITDKDKLKDVQNILNDLMDISIECRCKEKNDLILWLDAFNEPLKYFDSEHLCHCGGELWMDRIPETNKYGFVCDKCEWVKPNQTVSGAEGGLMG